MAKKKPEPNPIEKAIGDRAKPKVTRIGNPGFPQNPPEPVIPDVLSPQEMLSLEELNRRTVERLQEPYPEEEVPMTEIPITTASGKTANVPQAAMPPQKALVLKPDPQPVTKTCSPESPPQKDDDLKEALTAISKTFAPAEEVELTALRQYILEDGFVVATVAFHIVSLCAQPMTTPSTTTWAFQDRAMIPEMVLALLNQPGYLEGIWPSLRIVMGTNKGNAAWTAGIATTIAFFDVVRTLPHIEELKNAKV